MTPPEADPGVSLPRLASADPPRVELGASLALRGANLLPNPRVHIASRSLDTFRDEPADDALNIELPADLELSGCEEALDVSVETDHGLSEPVTVTAVVPAPKLSESNATVAAGTTLELHGSWLRQASASLRGDTLDVKPSGDNLRVALPRTAATGAASLSIRTACGETSLALSVLAAPPVLSNTDLKTVSPDGVLYVKADIPDRAGVQAVRVGTQQVPVTDTKNFSWTKPDQFGKDYTFAVRVPTGTPVQDTELTLITASGESNQLPLAVVSPAPELPKGPSQIRNMGLRAEDDGSFPVGSTSPFAGGDFDQQLGFEHSEWVYKLAFVGEKLSGDEDAGVPTVRQCNAGTFSGIELHCPQAGCTPDSEHPDRCACNSLSGCDPASSTVCHTIKGTFELSPKNNVASFKIDRTRTGGVVEDYVGGWATEDGSPVKLEGAPLRIVARSQRTGIQLMIVHYLSTSCSQAP